MKYALYASVRASSTNVFVDRREITLNGKTRTMAMLTKRCNKTLVSCGIVADFAVICRIARMQRKKIRRREARAQVFLVIDLYHLSIGLKLASQSEGANPSVHSTSRRAVHSHSLPHAQPQRSFEHVSSNTYPPPRKIRGLPSPVFPVKGSPPLSATPPRVLTACHLRHSMPRNQPQS